LTHAEFRKIKVFSNKMPLFKNEGFFVAIFFKVPKRVIFFIWHNVGILKQKICS